MKQLTWILISAGLVTIVGFCIKPAQAQQETPAQEKKRLTQLLKEKEAALQKLDQETAALEKQLTDQRKRLEALKNDVEMVKQALAAVDRALAGPEKIPRLFAKLLQLPDTDLSDQRPRIAVQFQDVKRRFGIVLTEERDPINPLKFKRLTYHENGQNNNTCVKINENEYLFGQRGKGQWARDDQGKPMDLVEWQPQRRWKSVMDFPESIRVTQVVQIVMSETTQVLDTCLVLYQIENNANMPHTVGIRCLIDTFIGSNDGVPFAVPGQPDLVDTMREIPQKDLPHFIQALERPDLRNPATVAHVGLKVGSLEPVQSLLICRWPDIIGFEVRWRWQPTPINIPPENKDSCVVLYWPELKMKPQEKRLVGYTYGLGRVGRLPGRNQPPAGRLALTAGGDFGMNGEFTVMAYVQAPQAGDTVQLHLPAGLALANPKDATEKMVKLDQKRDVAQVSWKVKGIKLGEQVIEADLIGEDAKRAMATYDVKIRAKGFFDVD